MKSFKYIPWILSALLLYTACAKEILFIEPPEMEGEGEETTLLIGLKSPGMEIKTRADMGQDLESAIVSLAIFIFDRNTGSVVSRSFHASAGDYAVDENGAPLSSSAILPDGSSFIPVETLTGNNRDIYVIANYDANTIEGLKAISTLSQLQEAIIEVVANPLFREFGLIKVGQLLNQRIRKQEKITVPLRFVSAKITVHLTNKYNKFTIDGWTVDNIPTKSYLLERTPNTADPNYHDAGDINNDHDYYNDFSNQSFPFEKHPGNGFLPNSGEYSSTFYMIENRRGGRVQREAPPVGWPYGSASDGERAPYQLKSWYAPPRATRLKIHGRLSDNSGNSTAITINHYLGENDSTDYNLSRGNHYIYHITIESMNKIQINTNVEMSDAQLRVSPAPDLMKLDAHFGVRPFRLHTHEVSDPGYVVSAEVLQAVNSDVPSYWLNLALFPTVNHQVRSSDGNINLWQQAGNDNTYVRTRFIPNKTTRSQLGAAYTPPAGVVIGSVNYPDDDTRLPYRLATHRMCKTIDSIPTAGNSGGRITEPLSIFLYADEYPFDNSPTAAAYREAVIRFTLSKVGKEPEYIYFTVRQYPALRFIQIPKSGQTTLLVERSEEYEQLQQITLPLDYQMLAGLQWGPYNLPLATVADSGSINTLHGVYADYRNPRNGTNYLSPKYGSATGKWNLANNGQIEEGAGVSLPTQGSPDFNFPLPTNNNVVNTTYNITAARYCHEKNWDRNGDGNIDANETVWYLPSTLEMQQFWTFHEILDLRPDYYWSSTQATADSAYAFSMLSDPADARRVYNGVRQSLNKTVAAGTNPPRVRCVRRQSGVDPISAIVAHRSDNTTVVDCSSFPGSIYTTQSKLNISQGDASLLQLANEKVYKRFEVQRTQPPATDYYTLHLGNGLCDSRQGWRLPTQREMLLLWSVKDKLEQPGAATFAPFASTVSYWTLTRGNSAHYLVNFGTGLSEYGSFFSTSHKFHYRCIREL